MRPLAGRRVLVTRAAHQRGPLNRALSEAGAEPVNLPALAIEPPRDPALARRRLSAWADYDLIVFVSPNAVDAARTLLERERLPSGGAVAAVGRRTAEALEAAGRAPTIVPAEGADSEALLSLDALHAVEDRRALIVRGEGGRALLGETLTRRGAEVDYAEVYRRAMPEQGAGALSEAMAAGLDLVTATSNTVLDHLVTMAGADKAALLSHPLVVVSRRMAAHARALGFTDVTVAEGADPEALTRAAIARLGR